MVQNRQPWIDPADILELVEKGHVHTSPRSAEYVIIIEWLSVYTTKLCSGCHTALVEGSPLLQGTKIL